MGSTATQLPPTATAEDGPTDFAYRAARSALPFAKGLAGECARIVSHLRRGDDRLALSALTDLLEEAGHFLQFLILIEEFVDGPDIPLTDYRTRLTRGIEGIGPALAHQDLVEVADAIDEDLRAMLSEYAQFDAAIQRALHPDHDQ